MFRRPLRTALTLGGLTIVILLVLIVVGFIRGLERSLEVSGDPDTAVIFSLGMGENLEYSSIPMRTSDLVPASVGGIRERYGVKYVSPELYLGTRVGMPARGANITDEEADRDAFGLVRGVTPSAFLVRRQFELEEGRWPNPGEIIVGKLVGTKISVHDDQIAVGQFLELEGKSWRISGIFSAGGSAFESEIWCRLDELQQVLKRQDLSIVAVTLDSANAFPSLNLFCKERLDLELQVMRETEYYETLQRDYRPIRLLAWLVIFLVSGAGVFAGLNTMYGSVVGRTAELSMLQTIGFMRRSVVVSLIQEGTLLSLGASLIAALMAVLLVNGVAVRFTMGAFLLRVDSVSILIGCGVGLSLGLLGSIPPAIRALRMPIIDGLKAV